MISVSLLTGCSDLMSNPEADSDPDYETSVAWSRPQVESTPVAQPQLDAAMPPEEYWPTYEAAMPTTAEPNESSSEFWSFPTEIEEELSYSPTDQSPVTPIQLPTAEDLLESDEIATNEIASDERPFGSLLRPLPAVTEQATLPDPPATFFANAPVETIAPETLAPEAIAPKTTANVEDSPQPVLQQLTEQEQMLAAMLRDCSSATTGVLTDQRVNELTKNKIRQAYAMATRGGLYVARQGLIEVLRMISQAKDAQEGSVVRTTALAAGLRALREAADFAPRGTQLEAELDIKVLCASHRTPVAKQPEYADLLPRLMMDRYLRYAQLQLALSVAGEPGGSMALHALGKLSRQLGRVEPDKHQFADRHAIAYQQAALLAHNQNYLAAHELGVLLANSGHLVEAQQLLQQVAVREPNAVVFRNLARVQEKLGQSTHALASQGYAHQLSQQGSTGTNNVQWVPPDQFAHSMPQTPRFATAQRPAIQIPAIQRPAIQRPAVQRPTDHQLIIPGSRQHPQPQPRR